MHVVHQSFPSIQHFFVRLIMIVINFVRGKNYFLLFFDRDLKVNLNKKLKLNINIEKTIGLDQYAISHTFDSNYVILQQYLARRK